MEKWGIGYEPCHNGVILFLSISDRVFYIYAGEAARKQLSDDALKHIIDNKVALLKEERYREAILNGINNIA